MTSSSIVQSDRDKIINRRYDVAGNEMLSTVYFVQDLR